MNDLKTSNWLTGLLREHPALLVSLIYIVATTIGMFYSWDYLRQFGINVFNYAQIGDFLMASLKEPFTWLLALFAVTLVAGDNLMSRRFEKRNKFRWLRWYGSERYRSINYLIAILVVAIFLHGYAILNAKKTFAGEGQTVEVRLTDDKEIKTTLLLDTTGQFLFLFNHKTRQVTIHPHENVRSISFLAP